MDDFVLFADQRQALLELLPAIEQYLKEHLALELKHKACWLNSAGHGLSFLGMRIHPACIRLRSENRRRCLRRADSAIKAWVSGYEGDERMAQRLASLYGHLHYFSEDL